MFPAFRRGVCTLTRGRCSTDVPVGIVGVPFWRGAGKEKWGLENGPDTLRKHGLMKELSFIQADVKDYGNVQVTTADEHMQGKTKFPRSVSATCQKVSESVKQVLQENRRCLVLGGDHSLGMGSVYGHSEVFSDLCVLWVDAHSDINTQSTSMSGNVHGMPCSFLLHELSKYKLNDGIFDWIKPCLKAKNIAYIGLHDVDPLEKTMLDELDIQHYTMSDIDRLGIFEVINRSLDAINPMGKKSLHVSFDIDSIDKTVISSTTTPLYGGLTIREVQSLAEEIYKRDVPTVVDIVEVDPSKGTSQEVNRTLDVTLLMMKSLMGLSRVSCQSKTVNQMKKEQAI